MRRALTSIVTMLAFCSVVPAQSSNPLSSDVRQAYEAVKANLLKTADKVPEEAYGFKPTPELRNLGEVLGHVVGAQERVCSAAARSDAHPMAKAEGKAAVTAALKQSFESCDKAYAALTDANASEMVKLPWGERTRLGALAGNITHDTEQYAILSVYMRLKGIVPPSSERSGGR